MHTKLTTGRLLYHVCAALCLLLPSAAYAQPESQCSGNTYAGALQHGWQLPSEGKNFHAYSNVGVMAGRNYVHSKVARTVVEAYALLEKSNPGITYIYGETGLREGGSFKPHKSHQNGLSVDFFVPVIDQTGKPRELSIGVTNQFGYAIEFDQQARFENLQIDFESMARHIDALAVAARKEGIGIEIVIFDNQFQPMLFASPTGRRLKGTVAFSVKKPWVRHDEHYHVNFTVACRAKAGTKL